MPMSNEELERSMFDYLAQTIANTVTRAVNLVAPDVPDSINKNYKAQALLERVIELLQEEV